MIIETMKLITKLFDSDITTYRMAKDTGLSQGTLDRYRSGQSDIGNMNLKTAKELEEWAMDTLNQMRMRFIGKNTQGRTVANIEVYGEDPMFKVYNELIAKDVISIVDYDPYQKASAEKAGYDYSELDERYSEDDENEEVNEILNSLPDLIEEEIYEVIGDENGNAYYQTFHIYIDGEEYEVDQFNFDEKSLWYEDEDGEPVYVEWSNVDS